MHVISVTMHNNSVTTKVAFFLGGREDVLHPRLQCDAAGVGGSSLFFSTGSPFGRHPRLSMVRLRRRREWICAVAQCLQCDADGGESISVWMLLKRRGGESVYRLYTICKNRGRRSSG